MLILHREKGQSFHILLEDGQSILVRLLSYQPSESDPNAVARIGIEAPKNISIVRTELLERNKVMNNTPIKKSE